MRSRWSSRRNTSTGVQDTNTSDQSATNQHTNTYAHTHIHTYTRRTSRAHSCIHIPIINDHNKKSAHRAQAIVIASKVDPTLYSCEANYIEVSSTLYGKHGSKTARQCTETHARPPAHTPPGPTRCRGNPHAGRPIAPPHPYILVRRHTRSPPHPCTTEHATAPPTIYNAAGHAAGGHGHGLGRGCDASSECP